MTWPEKHTCHRNEFGYVTWKDNGDWRPPEDRLDEDGSPRISLYRTCSYCGSIHPMDLLELLGKEDFQPYEKGMSFEEFIKHPHLHFADLKYGYPHKIYIESHLIIRPEQEFKMGTNFDRSPIMHKGYRPFMKFYTTHLDEPEASREDFDAVTGAILKYTGFQFVRDEGGLKWRCV